jgi:hypothetical protein
MEAQPPAPVVVRDWFRQELLGITSMCHQLVRLADLIDWSTFYGAQFVSTTGRPALPTRLVASLLYLRRTSALSDEEVVDRWVGKACCQDFRGERFFLHDSPCDPSSLVRWRHHIGEEGEPLDDRAGHHRAAQGDRVPDGFEAAQPCPGTLGR